MKAIIIGAGVGGLSTAAALQNMGVDVRVYEQADEPRTAGAGLSLWPNAVRVLRQLEINVRDIGVVLSAGLRRWNGKLLSRTEPQQLEARFGAPTIAVHRADLMNILLRQVGDAVQYGRRFERYDQDGERVCVYFTDGTSTEGDLLIGADGIRSAVRGQMRPDAQPVYRGYPAWRGVASFTHHHGIWGESWGRGARFGIIPLSEGRIYWFATANRPASTPPADHHAQLQALFGNWHAPIPALIDATPDTALLYNDIEDIEPLSTWIDGRVVLLGDAAHAMTPNMGQGACQAIEDAVALASALSKTDSLADSLTAYERQRLPHTGRVIVRSRTLGSVGQVSHPMLVALRDTLTRLTPSSITLRGLDFVMAP